MINIQKTGNAIVVDFTDNDKYLNNGTIEVAPNELMVVIDESNMATFKKMSNGDTLFGQLIDQIKIQGESVTKDNIIEKFGTIGFSVNGGGGGGAVSSVNGQTGDVVITATSLGAITKADANTLYASKSDLNSKANISTVEALSTEVAANRTATTALTSKVNEDSEKIASLDTEMDNKANSADVPTNTQFNDLAGEVANKADKTSVYTKAEADEKFTTNVELNQTLSEYATNAELNHVKEELATKADTSSLNDYALKSEITGLATKEELADYQPIGDYATTTQLNSKQDTLVSGQNIKTINGQSVIGEGNIDITEGGTIDSELSTVSENPVQNKVITNALNDKASKTELSNVSTSKANKADVYTKQEVDTKFTNTQSQIDQISTDTAAINAEVQTLKTDKQDTLVSGTNIKTINGQSLLGEGNIEIQQSELPIASADTLGGVKVGTGLSINSESGVLSANAPEWNNISGKPEDIVNITERLASKLDTATYNSEKSSFATKDELNSKADASAITDMATQTWVQNQGYLTEVPSNYVTNSELTEGLAGKQDKGDYALKSDLNTLATKEELATKADASALSSKQDTLISGTNIKTINGETILGAGDLTISSESRTWRFTCSSSITSGDLATITPDGFNSREWLSQVAIGDMVYLDKGQEFMKLSVSNIYHPTTGNTTVGLSFYSDRLYWVYVTGNSFSLKAHEVPSGVTNNATAIGKDAAVTSTGSYGVAIGYNARSNGYNAIVIGNNIQEDEQLSINIGDYLKVSYSNGFSYWDGTQMQSLKDQLASLTPPTVDTAMSDTSENAVQNKVIKKYIDDLVGNILTQLQEINGTIA